MNTVLEALGLQHKENSDNMESPAQSITSSPGQSLSSPNNLSSGPTAATQRGEKRSRPLDEDESDTVAVNQTSTSEAPRKRGRPRKPESEKVAKKPKVPGRGRGRPRLAEWEKKGYNKTKEKAPATIGSLVDSEQPVKKRGRPPKAQAEAPTKALPAQRGKPSKSEPQQLSGETPAKRGRPAKVASAEVNETSAKPEKPSKAQDNPPTRRGRPPKPKA